MYESTTPEDLEFSREPAAQIEVQPTPRGEKSETPI